MTAFAADDMLPSPDSEDRLFPDIRAIFRAVKTEKDLEEITCLFR